MLSDTGSATVRGVVATVSVALIGLATAAPTADDPTVKVIYRSVSELPRVAAPGTTVDFLDQRWVEDTHCLTRKLNQAELLPEPALRHDNVNCPLNAAGTVLRQDDGTFAFYYQTVPRCKPFSLPEDTPASVRKKWDEYRGTLYKYFLHYATSKDGIHWDLPTLGLRKSYPMTPAAEIVFTESEDGMVMQWLDDTNNNILLGLDETDASGHRLTGTSGVGGGFCIIDAKQTPHPAARARYTALYQNGGLCLACSDDGVQWTAYPENPIRVGQSGDTYNTLMYDPRREEYAMFCRPKWSRGGPDPRAVARIPSQDLIHWGPERIILQTDDCDAPAHGRRQVGDVTDASIYTRGRELQFYGFTPTMYQDLYIGFAVVFDTYASRSWIELVHSYDGIEWRREPRREPFISSVPESWNAGGLYFIAKGSPLSVDGYLYFYATAVNTLHGWHVVAMKDKGRIRWIAAARIRSGRFIGYATGVDTAFSRPDTPKRRIPPYWLDRGMLMTRPFRLNCEHIFLNAKVEAGGSIAVEILSALDAPPASDLAARLEPYRREKANPVPVGDMLRSPVTFRDAELSALHGETVRLRMHLQKATVYGLAFE